MPEREIRRVVNLNQREGRARDNGVAAAQASDETPRECCLAHTERSFERDDVSLPERVRQCASKARCGRFVAQCKCRDDACFCVGMRHRIHPVARVRAAVDDGPSTGNTAIACVLRSISLRTSRPPCKQA